MALQALAIVVQYGEPLGTKEYALWTGECYCDKVNTKYEPYPCENCHKDYDFVCRGKLRTKLAGCCKDLHEKNKMNKPMYRPIH